MIDSYQTIATTTEEVLLKEKGSKFFATAFPITNGDQLTLIIEGLKKKHIKAGHHCYAWKIGPTENAYRINDDGEPRNSAGAPIYGQIQSYGLSDLAVVVSRVFGGTKLGVSGLISAYKESASLALKSAQVITKTITVAIELRFGYSQMGQVMRLIEEDRLEIADQNLTESCVMCLLVPQSKESYYLNLINSWHPIQAVSLLKA